MPEEPLQTTAIRIEDESYTSTTGCRLFRQHHIPTGIRTADINGIAVFIHGLGDYGSRHRRVLEMFVRRGIYCIVPDLPGHGRSEGRRGYIQSIDTVHAIINENLECARMAVRPDISAGLLGHSMGGFLALHYLSHFPDYFDFTWISSPLIDARWHRSRLLQIAAKILGVLAPEFTIHSGVPYGACSRDPECIFKAQHDPLKHKQLTMRLGKILLKESSRLPDVIRNIHPKLKLFITHGSQDTVCPSFLSQALFEQIPSVNKRYALFEGLLHEPFNDIGSEAFFEKLNKWLDERSQTLLPLS